MCTRVFWNRNGVAKVCGRTMDWETSDLPRLWVIPRGTERHGATDHGAPSWTSRYGTASMQGWGVATTEAVNEAGLSARVLYLEATEWEPVDDRPVIANLMWTQYAADNYATVAEGLTGLSEVRVESVPIHGAHLGGHLLLEDASGDSALIEILGGTPTILHGPSTTSSPTIRNTTSRSPGWRATGHGAVSSGFPATSSPRSGSCGPPTTSRTCRRRPMPPKPWPPYSGSSATARSLRCSRQPL